ncbi:MAG: hypothetical protein GWN86_07070 [Desulfobacterales bacterium]|nr:hypothetical protein [Desulfobacterales bacterium]
MDTPKINLEELMEAVENDELAGWCVSCGERADDLVEPDARRYHCSYCGNFQVYGAEELLLMGVGL